MIDTISKGAAQSWQMENRWKTMVEGRFDFGFAVDWVRKDFGLVFDEARRNGAELPVTALVDQFYAEVQAHGRRPLRHVEPDRAAGTETLRPLLRRVVERQRGRVLDLLHGEGGAHVRKLDLRR